MQNTPFRTFLCHHCDCITTTWSCLIILFYGGREQVTTKFSLSIRTWIYVVVYRNSTSGKFANIWQSKWVGDKVGELLRTWPLFHNFRPLVLRQEPWPSRFHLPALWKPPDFGIWFLYRAQNSKSGFSQNNQVLLLTTPENTITYHDTVLLVTPPKFCISTVFQFLLGPFNSQEKLKTVLMQNFGGVTNKQYYD